MVKNKKNKLNVKERINGNFCDLSLSELSEVPVREISLCKRVTILDLSSNSLRELDNTFLTLTQLVKLDLSKNQIKILPEYFGLLRNLRHLDLYDNKLEQLPLSFGYLKLLRYLDLKGNPLTPALGKIVGLCLTTKDCQDTARRTVKFFAQMQVEAERTKEMYQQVSESSDNAPPEESTSLSQMQIKQTESETAKKSKKEKKNKNKKSNNTNNNNNNNLSRETVNPTKPHQGKTTTKPKKSNGNGHAKKNTNANSSTAFTSILTFFLLLAFNIGIIYMIMFKNPEIADKLVEAIPHQYRDWILTKTEIFRLRVTDWISEFRTPPEEH